MNAIKFIKDHGVDKAREVVEGAPEFPVFGYCALTGSYIFKRKDATAYYHNETNSWSEEYAIELISLEELKRFVESVDLVGEYGGLYGARDFISGYTEEQLAKPIYSPMLRLKQAIADYEAIYRKEDA